MRTLVGILLFNVAAPLFSVLLAALMLAAGTEVLRLPLFDAKSALSLLFSLAGMMVGSKVPPTSHLQFPYNGIWNRYVLPAARHSLFLTGICLLIAAVAAFLPLDQIADGAGVLVICIAAPYFSFKATRFVSTRLPKGKPFPASPIPSPQHELATSATGPAATIMNGFFAEDGASSMKAKRPTNGKHISPILDTAPLLAHDRITQSTGHPLTEPDATTSVAHNKESPSASASRKLSHAQNEDNPVSFVEYCPPEALVSVAVESHSMPAALTDPVIRERIANWCNSKFWLSKTFPTALRITEVAPGNLFLISASAQYASTTTRRRTQPYNGESLKCEPHPEIPPNELRKDSEILTRNHEVIECHKCSGQGNAECRKCSGAGHMSCSYCFLGSCTNCGATGRRTCTSCWGRGQHHRSRIVTTTGWNGQSQMTTEYYTERCYSCSGGYANCISCSGSGRCSTCGGSGKRTCSSCGGSGQQTCGECKGSGELHSYDEYTVKFSVKGESNVVGSCEDALAKPLRNRKGEEVFNYDSRQDRYLANNIPNEAAPKLQEIRSRVLAPRDGEVLLLETVQIRRYPFHEVTYYLGKPNPKKLWILGDELDVIAPRAPKRWSVIVPVAVASAAILCLAIWFFAFA